MKPTTFTFLSAVVLLIAFGHTWAVSEEPPKIDMKKVAEITSPGPMHKELEYFLGTWDVECKFVMPGMPDMPAEKLVAKNTWLMDGRWMSEDMKGTLMRRPYHSFSIYGYDNHTKNFVTTVVSNMDTAMNTFRGPMIDPEHKHFGFYGTINEYLDGTFNKPVRAIVKKVDADTFTREIWDMQIGPDGAIVMRFTFTRRTDK